jgi:multidrug transporter EmrE-like cation transporter
MPASALGLALGAAFVHALWNVLLARARETEAATVVAFASAVLVFAPVTAAVWRVDAAVWPYLLGSSALELGYFALLVAAYRRAELSLVYPLARGAAPVFVLAIGVAVLGTGTSGTQVAGVCLVGAGVLLVRGLRRPRMPGELRSRWRSPLASPATPSSTSTGSGTRTRSSIWSSSSSRRRSATGRGSGRRAGWGRSAPRCGSPRWPPAPQPSAPMYSCWPRSA